MRAGFTANRCLNLLGAKELFAADGADQSDGVCFSRRTVRFFNERRKHQPAGLSDSIFPLRITPA